MDKATQHLPLFQISDAQLRDKARQCITMQVDAVWLIELHAKLAHAWESRRQTVGRDTCAAPLRNTEDQWRLIEDALGLVAPIIELIDHAAQDMVNVVRANQARGGCGDPECEVCRRPVVH